MPSIRVYQHIRPDGGPHLKATRTTLIAASATLLLGLAGCSGGGGGGGDTGDHGGAAAQDNVYTFTTSSYASDADQLEITLPEGLREQMSEEQLNTVHLESISAQGRALNAELCAVDLSFTWAGNGADIVGQQTSFTDKVGYSEEDVNAEMDKILDTELTELRGQGSNAESERFRMRMEYETGELDEAGLREHVITAFEEGFFTVSGEVSIGAAENAAIALTDKGPRGAAHVILGEVDEEDPQEGLRITEDLTSMTIVDRCASSTTDDSPVTSVVFPMGDAQIERQQDQGSYSNKQLFDTFAEVEIGAMQNGTVYLIEGSVTDFTTDANGDWIAG